MAENYARAASIDLAGWLEKNAPPCICEPKFDGFRVFLFKSGDKILFATRHGVLYSESSHPVLFKKIQPLRSAGTPDKLVLDGEFRGPDDLWIFDILQLGGKDVTGEILSERKKILSDILVGDKEFLMVKFEFANSFQEVMSYKARMLALNEEGIVVKNPSSTYGQKGAWLKIKNSETVDCFVLGIDKTIEMERTGIPHSWFIGLYDNNGRVVEMGKVGTYLKEVDPSRIEVGTIVEIQFQQVTADLKFRGPFILRIREDKKKEECTFSQIPTLSRV
jgi:ATP-dependent DNA ligase